MRSTHALLLGLALLSASGGAQAQQPQSEKASAQAEEGRTLTRLDRTFACPETLPSDKAREKALKDFVVEVQAVEPGLTADQVMGLRVELLRSHHCAGP